MLAQASHIPVAPLSIALIDGDAAIRRERQLMLLSEKFDVRSYATCAAVLADLNARASSCLVVDVEMPEMSGAELIRTMRASGWDGTAILLAGSGAVDAAVVAAMENGDIWLPKSIADRPFLDAIRAAVDGQVASLH